MSIGAHSQFRPEKRTCPACGRQAVMLFRSGWIDGKAAECRVCGQRVTNAEWRALEAK